MTDSDPIEPGREAKPRTMHASEEIIDMLAEAPHILAFEPSDKARKRVWDLVAREKRRELSPKEQLELEHYAQIEHLMRLVKARARKRSQRSS